MSAITSPLTKASPVTCSFSDGAEELPIIIELVVVLPLSVTSCKVSSWYSLMRFFLLNVTILPTGTIASNSKAVIVNVVSLADWLAFIVKS